MSIRNIIITLFLIILKMIPLRVYGQASSVTAGNINLILSGWNSGSLTAGAVNTTNIDPSLTTSVTNITTTLGNGVTAINDATASINAGAAAVHEGSLAIKEGADAARYHADAITHATDPGRLALGGFGFGAGMVFGQMAAHLIVNASFWTVSNGYNFLMGNLDDEARKFIAERTKNQIAKLEMLTKQVSELDKKMANHIFALSTLVEGRTPMDLAFEISELEREQKRLAKKASTSKNISTRRAHFEEANNLELKIKHLKEVLAIVDIEKSSIKNSSQLCDQFSNMKHEWLDYVADMKLARSAILVQPADLFKQADMEIHETIKKVTNHWQDEKTCNRNESLEFSKEKVLRNGQVICFCEFPKSWLANGNDENVFICSAVCKAKDAAEKFKTECLNQIDANQKAKQTLNIQVSNAIADSLNNRREKASEILNRLRTSDCKLDQKSTLCNGKPGSFEILRDLMSSKFKKISTLCNRPDFEIKESSTLSSRKPNSNKNKILKYNKKSKITSKKKKSSS